MGYVATGGAIESTVRDELLKNMPILFGTIGDTTTTIELYKRTFDFGDIDYIIIGCLSYDGAGANNDIDLYIDANHPINETLAGNPTPYYNRVDCSSYTGNMVLRITVDVGNERIEDLFICTGAA